MRSKLFSLLALLTFASFILAACGGAAPQTPAAPTAASGAAAPTAASGAAAPTAAPAAGTQLAVGIVLPTKDETRWTQDEARFKEALDKAGYQVEILFSEKDSAKEKANVELLITKGIKVLILTPVDGTAAASTAAAARAAGVKVISYDRLIRDTDAVDYYVTFDSMAVGAQQAQYLVDKAGSAKGQPLYIYAGAASDNNAFIFFQGAWGVLQPKIADGTFVIKNSSEAIALQEQGRADPRRAGQDHRAGHDRLGTGDRQDAGRVEPDHRHGGRQGRRVHPGAERRHRARDWRHLRGRQGREELRDHRAGCRAGIGAVHHRRQAVDDGVQGRAHAGGRLDQRGGRAAARTKPRPPRAATTTARSTCRPSSRRWSRSIRPMSRPRCSTWATTRPATTLA